MLGVGRLFDAMRDAAIVADTQGTIVLWNPAAERMLGHTAEEAVGQNVLILIPQEFHTEHKAGITRFRETGHGRLVDSHDSIEVPARRKDGSLIRVELTLSPFRDEDSDYVLAMVRDVTARARAREEIDEQRATLMRANDMLETFSYVVAHDLREPVRGILTMLKSAREHAAGAALADELELAEKNATRLGQLLEGLLGWSRAAQIGIDVQVVDVASVIASDECSVAFQALARARGARVDIRTPLPAVLASPTLVCQIFSNLIVNAIKHNEGPAPLVTVREGDSDSTHVEILVEDDGPGFPDAVIKRVNDMGGMRPRTLQGGFGLNITVMVVHRLGGEVHVGATPAGGGAVRIRLPRPTV